MGFVFGSQRRSGHMRNHEAGIQTRRRHQERWQTRDRGVDQQCDTALRNRANFRNRECQCIGRKRDWLSVEITTGNDFASFNKHQRIIGHGIRFNQQSTRRVIDDIQAGTHDLRLAAQAVWVLHAFVIDQMGLADFAAGQQRTVNCCGRDLARLTTAAMNTCIKRCIAAFSGIDRQSAGNGGRFQQTLCQKQTM